MRTCRVGNIDDLDAIYRLNKRLFAEGWSKQSLAGVMLAGYDLYVFEISQQLAGYILSQDILDEVHIMQVAVSPDYQRQGIGRQLSEKLLSDKQHQQLVLLEVRASNSAAQALYNQLQFTKIGRRKGYYVPQEPGGEREDAIVMQRILS